MLKPLISPSSHVHLKAQEELQQYSIAVTGPWQKPDEMGRCRWQVSGWKGVPAQSASTHLSLASYYSSFLAQYAGARKVVTQVSMPFAGGGARAHSQLGLPDLPSIRDV